MSKPTIWWKCEDMGGKAMAAQEKLESKGELSNGSPRKF
jgi:hypothetical protein